MPRSEGHRCRSNLPLEKDELENGKSFLFSVDHGKIYILGIIYYEIQGCDNPSKKNSWLSSILPKGRSMTPKKSVKVILIFLSLNKRILPKGPDSLSCCTLLKPMRQHHIIPAKDMALICFVSGTQIQNVLMGTDISRSFSFSCFKLYFFPNYLVLNRPGRKFSF